MTSEREREREREKEREHEQRQTADDDADRLGGLLLAVQTAQLRDDVKLGETRRDLERQTSIASCAVSVEQTQKTALSLLLLGRVAVRRLRVRRSRRAAGVVGGSGRQLVVLLRAALPAAGVT